MNDWTRHIVGQEDLRDATMSGGERPLVFGNAVMDTAESPLTLDCESDTDLDDDELCVAVPYVYLASLVARARRADTHLTHCACTET